MAQALNNSRSSAILASRHTSMGQGGFRADPTPYLTSTDHDRVFVVSL